MAANIPATALSRFPNTYPNTVLAIGNSAYYPQIGTNFDLPIFWYVIVDLQDNLNVVVNVTSQDNTTLPPQVTPYVNNPRYFLFFIGNSQPTYNLPQGTLYSTLLSIGSDTGLQVLEQIAEQIGTGAILNFSYVLGATLDTNDGGGFEAYGTSNYSVLTMQFMPVTVDGQTIYAPIQLAAAPAA